MAVVLRGLLEHVSITFAQDDPERASRGGWVFDTPEPVFGASDLRYVRLITCKSNPAKQGSEIITTQAGVRQSQPRLQRTVYSAPAD